MRPTRIIVDLGAITHNITVLRSRLRPQCQYMAVVKANAYGHGIVETAKAAISAGAQYLGVAVPEEGIALRQAGIDAPILVLGGTLEDAAKDVVRYDLSQTVFAVDTDTCGALMREAAQMGKRCGVHIKINTGMNRIGVNTRAEFMTLISHLEACPNIIVQGLFTHFAVSDIEDKTFTRTQFNRFMEYAQLARERGLFARNPSLLLHCANSGAILDLYDDMQLDMVRGGIAMYGYSPDPCCGKWAGLKPAMAWKTAIVQLKEIAEGESVSYGRTYTATEPRVLATLPVGYGDGYKRCMSGKAFVLVHGKRAPLVGRICMDQCMADVTGIMGVQTGDEVVLMGRQESECISADELADWAGTIGYEVLLSVTARVPRIYV